MLPFLNAKKISSIVIAKRGQLAHEVSPEVEAPSQEGMNADLKMAAEDLLRAVDHKSVLGVCSALQAAFAACDQDEDEENEDAFDPTQSEEA